MTFSGEYCCLMLNPDGDILTAPGGAWYYFNDWPASMPLPDVNGTVHFPWDPFSLSDTYSGYTFVRAGVGTNLTWFGAGTPGAYTSILWIGGNGTGNPPPQGQYLYLGTDNVGYPPFGYTPSGMRCWIYEEVEEQPPPSDSNHYYWWRPLGAIPTAIFRQLGGGVGRITISQP